MNNDLNTKPLIIDGQLWQTSAWDRGMGKYTLSLLEAYANRFGSEHITVVLNSDLETSSHRLSHLKSIMPKAKFNELKLPVMPGDIELGRKNARNIWDSFINKQFSHQKVNFLILNLFTFDYCATFPSRANKMFIFYDLLPLIYWQDYSQYFSTSLYFAHFQEIFDADLILSISEDAKNSLINELAINPEKIVNLSGAYIERHAKPSSSDEAKTLGRYVLMPTSDFPNKNNLNAVQGFAEFNEIFGDTLSLVLTSDLSDSTKEELSAYSENLVFAGNVSEERLAALFQDCELVLSTPHTEGLGLPILEAIANDKPVVCSDIAVFREVSNKALYFCNQNNPDSIASALLAAFSKEGWQGKQEQYPEILNSFSWGKSAKTFAESMKRQVVKSPNEKRAPILVVLPSPDEWDNSVGQLVQKLSGYLYQRYKVSYFSVSSNPSPLIYPNFLRYLAPVKDIKHIRPSNYSEATTIIYGIDESTVASQILADALARPGVVILNCKNLVKNLNQLIEKSYLDKALASRVFGEKPSHEKILDVLAELGNRTIDLNSNHEDNKDLDKPGDARQFAEGLTKVIKQGVIR